METGKEPKKEKISYTDEQLEVIRARNCDLLVSAAAGSGKTAVLAERIVRLVTEGDRPCDIDRILVVTFTRAAASGMREKIAGVLSDRIAADPDNRHLRRQEILLPHARIMTIDAFCQYLLRNNFHAIGLDPSFRVSDEGEMRLLEQEAMSEILEEAYTTGDPAFLNCMDALSQGAGDEQAEGEILKLYRFAQTMPWPVRALEELLEVPEEDERIFGATAQAPEWIKEVIQRIRKELAGCIEELKKAEDLIGKPGGPWMYQEMITSDIESLTALSQKDGFQEMYDYLQNNSLFMTLSRKKDDSVRQELRDRVRKLRDEVKKAACKNIDRYFKTPPQILLEREKAARSMTQVLVRLAVSFISRLEQKKQEKNLIDFSDMEHLALRILLEEPEKGRPWSEAKPTRTADAYAEFFQEVMVDEYQDSNMIQELILDAVSAGRFGRPDRFMVGDIKQSIYRFRLARPEIFAEKMVLYAGDDPGTRRIDLHRNFRSRKQVLSAVNAIHERLMSADIGGVEYDEDARLVPGLSYPEADQESLIPELLLIPEGADPSQETEDAAKGTGENMQDALSEQSEDPESAEDPGEGTGVLTGREKLREEAEAEAVAARIQSLMAGGQVRDEQENRMRPVRFSDIAILLRTTSGVDDIYRDVLTAHGIPVHVESKAGYFQTTEIRLLINLLHAIENPLRDIPLAAFMHSFLGGFSDEEMARIRTADQKEGHSYYEAVLACAEQGQEEALAQKCRDLLKRLSDLRNRSMQLSVRDFLEEILLRTGYLEIVSAMPGGRRRRANVRMLLLRAAAFSESGGHGLAAFTERLEQYRLADIDLGEASTLSEDADIVHLMSIHKSKGLEFPVVFVSGLSRRFNRSDERGSILVDEHIGIGARIVDLGSRVSFSTLRRLVIAEKLHEESLGEEIRVLYVAMTRAREKLILTGTMQAERARTFLQEHPWSADENGADENGADENGAEGAAESSRAAGTVSYGTRFHASSFLELLLAAIDRGPVPMRLAMFSQTEGSAETAGRSAAREQEEARKTVLTNIVNGNDNDCYQNPELREKLRFSYAHGNLAGLFVKTTVTELKERLLEEEAEGAGHNKLYQSTDAPETGSLVTTGPGLLSGAERGTAYHKAMELIDAGLLDQLGIFNHDINNRASQDERNIVYEWMKKQESGKRLPDGSADTIRPEDLLLFLQAPLGRRFIRAFRDGQLFRERQFMMGVDAARIGRQDAAGEMVLVQGVIDVYFREGEDLILLDYKTDRVSGDGTELAEKYGVQLALYAEALGRVTGRKVSEKWIWSFALGAMIPVTTERTF